MYNNLSSRLDSLRGDLSFDEFGKLVGLSGEVVRKHCKGISEPKAGRICHYSEVLHVSADWILGLPHSGSGDSISASVEVSRLLGIIESQQRAIETLAGARKGGR